MSCGKFNVLKTGTENQTNMLLAMGIISAAIGLVCIHLLRRRYYRLREEEEDLEVIVTEDAEIAASRLEEEEEEQQRSEREREYRELYDELFPKCQECREDPSNHLYSCYDFCHDDVFNVCRECHRPVSRDPVTKEVRKSIKESLV